LTVAVGSLDGEAARIVSAIAGRLAATNAGVRLNVIETSSALEAANAFSSGKTDLAVVRGDVGDLSQAQAVIVVARAVARLVAQSGPSIADLADLKRATVGVVGGETNRKIVAQSLMHKDAVSLQIGNPPSAPDVLALATHNGGALVSVGLAHSLALIPIDD
jgi:TRAP-type uncharacterized transport system substrate-binding protein